MRARKQQIEDELARFSRPTKDDREAVRKAVDLRIEAGRDPTAIKAWVKAEEDVLVRLIANVQRHPKRHADD